METQKSTETENQANDISERLDGRHNVATKTTGRATSTDYDMVVVEESGKDADRFLTKETSSDQEASSAENSAAADNGEANWETGDPEQRDPDFVDESTVEQGHKASFTPDHDVLTKGGWKPVGKVSTSDEVTTLDTETDDIQYQAPTDTQQSLREGKMYRVKSQQIDLKVTPGHKMYVNPRNPMVNGEEYAGHRLMQADSIAGKRVRYKTNGIWKGKSSSMTQLDALDVGTGKGSNNQVLADYATKTKVPTNELFELTGLVVSDGFTRMVKSGNYRIEIVQCPQAHPEVYSRIPVLFRKCGASVYERPDRVIGVNKQLYSFMNNNIPSGAANKRVPRWMLSYDTPHLEALLDGLMAGDGHETKTGTLVYTSTSKGLCGDVHEIALKTGQAARVCQHNEAGTSTFSGRKINQQACYKTHVRADRLTPTINHSHVEEQDAQTEEFVDYSGVLHSCTVPNGVIYVRRNGKACWCGSSSGAV